MLISTPEIEIKSLSTDGTACLEFTFMGRFTKEASFLTSKAWIADFKKPFAPQQYTLVFDLSKMTKFDISARHEIIRCLGMFENRISKVIVISDDQEVRETMQTILNLFLFNNVILDSESSLLTQKQPSFSRINLSNLFQPALSLTLPLFSILGSALK